MWRSRSKTTDDPHGFNESANARTQALQKQLSQLDATSSKIGETLRFLSDFRKDDSLAGLQSSPQQMHQLAQLQEKLKDAVYELERLQGVAEPEAQPPVGSHSLPSAHTSNDGSVTSSALGGLGRNVSGGGTGGGAAATESAAYSAATAAVASKPPGGGGGAASDGATVNEYVARLTQQTADGAAGQLGRVKAEQQRLEAIQKEIADLEAENKAMQKALSTRDVHRLREQVKSAAGSLRKAEEAEAQLASLTATVARLPALQEEVAGLRPKAEQVAELEGQLRALRTLDDKRMRLTREIATMQPKAAAAEKLAARLEQLEGEAARNEELGARLGELQAQADKLPGLRSRMNALQASAAEARQLERLLSGFVGQEELMGRLHAEEEALAARVAGVEDLKRRVEELRLQAREVDALEQRSVGLAPIAARLPGLREEMELMYERAGEVEALEGEVAALPKLDQDVKALRGQVESHALAAESARRDASLDASAAFESDRRSAASLEASDHLTDLTQGGFAAASPTQGGFAAASGRSPGRPGPGVRDFVRTLSANAGGGESASRRASGEGGGGAGSLVRRGSVEHHPRSHPVAVEEHAVAPSPMQASTAYTDGAAGHVRLNVTVAEAPPLSLTLNVLVPPEPLEPGTQAALDRARAAAAALRAANEEMADLAGLQRSLQAQLDVRRASPAAAQVVRMQQELLEMQSWEVDTLTRSVANLSDVGDRLSALQEQHAALEKEADEVFVMQSQLPELMAAAAQGAKLRRQQAELREQAAEVSQLTADIAATQAAIANVPRLRKQFEEMARQGKEVEALRTQVAGKPAVEARLSTLREQRDDLAEAQAQAEALALEVDAMRARTTALMARMGGGDPADDADSAAALLEQGSGPLPTVRESGDGRFDYDSELGSGRGTVFAADGELRQHLQRVRAGHAALAAQNAELQRLSHEAELLLADNDLLRAQINVAVQAYGAAGGEGGEGGGSPGGGAELASARGGGGGEAGEADKGAAAPTPTAPAGASPSATQLQGSLAGVFQRLRDSEVERAELAQVNEELSGEVDQLRSALATLTERMEAFKGLAASVSMIRSNSRSSGRVAGAGSSRQSGKGPLDAKNAGSSVPE